MSLTVRSIEFKNFRNYQAFSLDGIGPLTIFVGQNAVGKTNVIEGVQLLCAMQSFRHPLTESLVRFGAESARLRAEISDGNRLLEFGLDVCEHRKSFSVNGKARHANDIRGKLPVVTFTPDDLDLVKGANAGRRAWLDVLGVQLSSNHCAIKSDYEKVVRYKNRLLKEEASDALLDSIDDTLIMCGAQFACYRTALFFKLEPLLSRHYETISGGGERLSAHYTLSWEQDFAPCAVKRDEARTMMAEALKRRRSEERSRKKALVGPHADAIGFTLDGLDAGSFASQGQQRSIVLACKLAEVNVAEDVLGQKPVLLLDDVMSELDERRRHALVTFILDDTQTFITTTNLDYFDDQVLSAARIVRLPMEEHGETAVQHHTPRSEVDYAALSSEPREGGFAHDAAQSEACSEAEEQA